MGYQVLARKWRPQNFKQMVGQEHVLRALIHALESNRLHHAYLFTGTRGVGKTTIGRILAKCLSCHDGVTAEPCGTCGACVGISEGRYVDLIEIDAASRTKVEDMRELLENVQYAPSEGRFKIYLIDEVHMLSQSSFNALLKTLEEPPEHVKFLFATTDPQKLPVTILSRCLQFNLKNMSPERIVGHLKHVLSEETVEYEDGALWALARAADGSMRDALSLTDQAIAYGHSNLRETEVSAMLGTVDQKRIYHILESIISNRPAEMLKQVAELAEFSPDYASVLASLSSVLHRVAIEQMVPGATDNSLGDQAEVKSYASRLCAEDVQLFYQVALVSRKDMAMSPDPKSALEMALLRMISFQLEPTEHQSQLPIQEPVETISTENSESIQALDQSAESRPETGVPSETLDHSSHNFTTNDERPEPPTYDPVSAGVLTAEDELMRAGADQELTSESSVHSEDLENAKKKTELKDSQVEPDSSQSTSVDSNIVLGDLREDARDWAKTASELGLSGMTQNLLFNMVFSMEEAKAYLYVEPGHFRLLNRSHEQRISDAVKNHFGVTEVTFVEGVREGQETPMMWKERRASEMLANAQSAVEKDENVLRLINEFEASLVPGSVVALGSLHE